MLDLSQFFIRRIVEKLSSQVAELTGIVIATCNNLYKFEKEFFFSFIFSSVKLGGRELLTIIISVFNTSIFKHKTSYEK